MQIRDYDTIMVRDGRKGLVYAMSADKKKVLVVFEQKAGTDERYPLVDGGFLDGAVSVPVSDVLTVLH